MHPRDSMRPPTVEGGDTLLGWPSGLSSSPRLGSLCALGVPSDAGNVISRGSALGPAALRETSRRYAEPNEFLCDFGDVDFAGATGSSRHLEATARALRCIDRLGAVPLMLGGDHSLSFAPISLLQDKHALCLVWLDAHTDFSPWDDRDFHNHKQVLRRIETLPGVTRIVQLGYRGVTVGDERQLGPKSTVVTSPEMQRGSPAELAASIPDNLPCYISIDIDVIDPFYAPGTSAPVPGGVLPDMIIELLALLTRTRTIAGVDIVEVNPALDRDDDTVRIALRMIEALAENWECQIERRECRSTNDPRERRAEGERVL